MLYNFQWQFHLNVLMFNQIEDHIKKKKKRKETYVKTLWDARIHNFRNFT